MNPIILTCASTGNKWLPKDSEFLPANTTQIIEDTLAAYEAGASMFHLHARNDDGMPTHDPAKMKILMDTFRRECPDIVLQMSVGGMEGEMHKKLEPLLALRPDYATFNLLGTDEETLYMARLFEKYEVKPCVECFNLGMLHKIHKLLAQGVLKNPLLIEMLFELKDEGRNYEQMANELLTFKEWLPDGAIWSQTRGAKSHVQLQAIAAAMGGNIRTGMEDCLNCNGNQVKGSAELIQQAKEIAVAMGRKIATPAQASEMLKVQH